MRPAELINRMQRRWALRADVAIDEKGYVSTFDDNLFLPVDETLRREFGAGGGGEMVEGRRRAKMRATHSSSALAVNVFAYFRQSAQLGVLGDLLDMPGNWEMLAFERKRPTGISQANLDVDLTGDRVLAIESKFREPYEKSDGRSRSKAVEPPKDPLFSPRYFSSAGLWGQLPCCKALASELQARHEVRDPLYKRLDAAQLLKHLVALTRSVEGARFRLLYLWFEVWEDGRKHAATEQHERELAGFVERIDPDIDFRSLTYQEFYRRMEERTEISKSYREYLASRYFNDGRIPVEGGKSDESSGVQR